MAKPTKGKVGSLNTTTKHNSNNEKVTSIGHSRNTRFSSKNDKRNKKSYRGQGK